MPLGEGGIFQPSAAKWNILGTNDASFNNGTGLGDDTILATKMALAATSSANGGTAGGTQYQLDLGTLKLCWLKSAAKSNSNGQNNYTWTLPSSFFSTIQTVIGTISDPVTTANQFYITLSSSTSTITTGIISTGASTGTINALVIGT